MVENAPQAQIQIDIEAIRRQAKTRWYAENRRQVGLLDRVESSVPWWLVIIAGVLFLLSAPHTAETFGKLTPVLGWLAPLAVEFSLLYAAFRRKWDRQAGRHIPAMLWALEILFFITAIIVNGAGSLSAVVSAVGLQALSLTSIIDGFGSLPATTQVALLLVPIAAFVIPIGTSVTGEGLATLVFERSRTPDPLADKWAEAEYNELRRAFFIAYKQSGMRHDQAVRQANLVAGGLIDQSKALALSAPSASLVPPVLPGQDGGTGGTILQDRRDNVEKQAGASTGQAGQLYGTGGTPRGGKRDAARKLLADNPDLYNVPLRTLEAQTGIDKNAWAAVKAEYAAVRSNGHSADTSAE